MLRKDSFYKKNIKKNKTVHKIVYFVFPDVFFNFLIVFS